VLARQEHPISHFVAIDNSPVKISFNSKSPERLGGRQHYLVGIRHAEDADNLNVVV
jgi:hypothetical protein